MNADVIALIVVCGWFVSLSVAIFLVPRLAAKRVSMQFGLQMVEQGGKKFYAPCGPDGEPILIPVGVKDVDGEQKVVMGYAPLAYSMPFMAADMAAMKLKMMLLGQKGQISQAIRNKALSEGDQEALFAMLPKKVQGALAIARMLGVGVNKGVPDGQVQVVNRGKAI
jgi:hypothetical protein